MRSWQKAAAASYATSSSPSRCGLSVHEKHLPGIADSYAIGHCSAWRSIQLQKAISSDCIASFVAEPKQ
jgi:hypothetical protein